MLMKRPGWIDFRKGLLLGGFVGFVVGVLVALGTSSIIDEAV